MAEFSEKTKYRYVPWEPARMRPRLEALVERFGYVPSCAQLRAVGENTMACQVSTSGGAMRLAERYGLPYQRGSAVQQGRDGELWAANLLRSKGLEVRKMNSRYAFDLLVSGRLRVDVKTGRIKRRGKNGEPFWVFALKKIEDCDYFMFLLLPESGEEPLHVFYVPRSKIKVDPTKKTPMSINLSAEHRLARYREKMKAMLRFGEGLEEAPEERQAREKKTCDKCGQQMPAFKTHFWESLTGEAVGPVPKKKIRVKRR